MTRTAVIFGAGKMAGGLLGHLLSEAGYTIQFVARRPEVVSAINRHGGYRLTIAGQEHNPLAIRGCEALPVKDASAVVGAVGDSDVVFTAVGIDNLPAITPLIAAGLEQRGRRPACEPLNVVACENLPGTGAYLRHLVLSSARPEARLVVERVGGFAAASTRRIMTGGDVASNALRFHVDSSQGLVVDRQGLSGNWPTIAGVQLTDEFNAYVMRKLFTLNCAQALVAYLGHRVGCQYIHEAAAHPWIAPLVRAAMAEAEAALMAELPNHANSIRRDISDALAQMASERTPDLIARVARDPRRKLSPRERLVGPARLAHQHGLPYNALARAIAAALAYDAPGDAQAVALQRSIARGGLDEVLTEDCGLLPHSEMAGTIKREWRAMAVTASRPATVTDALRSLIADLARRYDPALVGEALARLAQEHGETRIALGAA